MRWVLLLLCALAMTPLQAHENVWLRIDTDAATLSVMRGHQVVTEFSNISVGRGGVAALRTRGDDRTPLGAFRVSWINTASSYHRFFGFNYPTLDQAQQALGQGIIDNETYDAIAKAVYRHRLPPQDTPLGGHLGIHGLGSRDLGVHQAFNWTNGCIALTNEQIEALEPWVELGIKVIIH